MYHATEYAKQDRQHRYFTDEFDFRCLSGFNHKITRKLSEVTNTYSLEYYCMVPTIQDHTGEQYERIYSHAYEVEMGGEFIVTGRFKIYTGNCVLLTLNCKCDMDRKTMSNMIRWLTNRELMKFCKILDKHG